MQSAFTEFLRKGYKGSHQWMSSLVGMRTFMGRIINGTPLFGNYLRT